MSKRELSVPALLLLAAAGVASATAQTVRMRPDPARRIERASLVILDGTRETDGLKGPVRRVGTEAVMVEVRQGRPFAHPPSLLERTLYNVRGRRTQNETYPVGGGGTGWEAHKYDVRGNVVETTVRDAGGAALSRMAYEYEFDDYGNWIRMTASVAVSNLGRTEYEPFEITTRSATYYAAEEAGGGAPQTNPPPAPVVAGEWIIGHARDEEHAQTATSPASPCARGVINYSFNYLP
jgi:hypothetical protein